VSFIWFKQQY